jgi:hypothetical protein
LRSTILQRALPETDFIWIAQQVVYQFLDLDFHWQPLTMLALNLATFPADVHSCRPKYENLSRQGQKRTKRHLLAK